MLCQAYDEYKRSVLNAINSGKNLCLVSKYEYKDVSDHYVLKKKVTEKQFKQTRLVDGCYYIGNIGLLRDGEGKYYGRDLLDYMANNNLICGSQSIHIPVAVKNDAINYDFYGRSTCVKSCLMGLGIEQFLSRGYSSSYINGNQSGFFCIDEVDEDGIVVMPPECSALVLFGALTEDKIKRIISFVCNTVSPAMFRYDGWISDMKKDTITTLDCTNTEYEVYHKMHNFIIVRYDATGYVRTEFNNQNGDYAFKFKCLRAFETGYTVTDDESLSISVDENEYPVELNLQYTYKHIRLGIDVDNSNLIINSAHKIPLLSIIRMPSHNTFNGELSLTNIDACSIETTNIKMESFNNLVKSLNTDVTLIVAPYALIVSKLSDIDHWLSIFRGLSDAGYILKHNAVNVKTHCGRGGYSTDKLYTEDSLMYAFFVSGLMYCYSKEVFKFEDIEAFENKDLILEYMDRFYGVSKSSCGDLQFMDVYNRCYNNPELSIKEYDVLRGEMIFEAGAGVRISVNLMQFFLLRLFGMDCYYVVALSNNTIYGAPYVTTANRRYSIDGYEMLFMSKSVGVKITDGSNDLDYYAVVFGLTGSYAEPFLRYYEEGQGLKYYINYTVPYAKNSTKYCANAKRMGIDWGLNAPISMYGGRSETTIKYLDDVAGKLKQMKQIKEKEFELLGMVTHSKTVGLYDGIQVKCTGQKTVHNYRTLKNMVMDKVKFKSNYVVFDLVDDSGKTYQVEGSTLYDLLSTGNVVCDNLNHTLVDSEVVYIRDEYDSHITEIVEQLKGSQMLLKDDSLKYAFNQLNFYSVGAGYYGLQFYNVGEELMLPSFVAYLHEVLRVKSYVKENYGSFEEIKKIGLEVGNTEPVDVTDRIYSLLEDTSYNKNAYNAGDEVCTGAAARKPGVEFYCSELAYVKGSKVLKISSVIANKLLELPQNLSIDFNYPYEEFNYKYKEEAPETKIVVRKGSTVYTIKCASEIELGDGCLIHPRAFAKSRLETLVLKGGKLPEYACSGCMNLKRVVVDGGHADIHVLAFEGCKGVEEIECINGGTYTLIGSDNAIVMNVLKENKNGSDFSKLYEKLLNEYEQKETEGFINAVPCGINSDYTLKLRQKDGKEVNLSFTRICSLLDSEFISFKYTLQSGEEIDFLERLSYTDLRCLAFIPGINNDFCASKVLVLLDIDRVQDMNSLRKCNIIFAYQYADWTTGGVKSLPMKYLNLEHNGGLFFDSAFALVSTGIDAVCCGFWQNLSYYSDGVWEDFRYYYEKQKSYRPEEWSAYGHRHLNTFYLPASHEMNYRHSRMDNNFKKGYVVVGGESKYAKKMHNKCYAIAPAKKVVIIPGIGENCVMEFRPLTYSDAYDWSTTLWGECNELVIKAPTVFTLNACTTAYNSKRGNPVGVVVYRSNAAIGHPMEVSVYAPTRMHLGSVAFQALYVYGTDLTIDCSGAINWSNYRELTGKINPVIKLEEGSKISVLNLSQEVLTILYKMGYYALALQLLVNSSEFDNLKDTYVAKELLGLAEKKGEDADMYKAAASTAFKAEGELEVKAEPYKVPKKIKNQEIELVVGSLDESGGSEEPLSEPVEGLDEDAGDNGDDSFTDKERKEQIKHSLEEGIIPPIISLNYIEEHMDEESGEVVTTFSDLEHTDEVVDFSSLSSKSAQMLVDMCGVDVKGVQERYDKQREEEDRKKQELLAIQHEEEAKQAKEQQTALLNALTDSKEKAITDLVEDQKARDEESRAKAREEYEKDQQSLGAESVEPVKESIEDTGVEESAGLSGNGTETSVGESLESVESAETETIDNEPAAVPVTDRHELNQKEPAADNKNIGILAENVGKPNTKATMSGDLSTQENNEKLASSLKSSLAGTDNELVNTLRQRTELEVGRELCKNGQVLGYEVLNKSTGDIKRLPVDTVKKLCKDLRYKITGVRYDRFSNTLVR